MVRFLLDQTQQRMDHSSNQSKLLFRILPQQKLSKTKKSTVGFAGAPCPKAEANGSLAPKGSAEEAD